MKKIIGTLLIAGIGGASSLGIYKFTESDYHAGLQPQAKVRFVKSGPAPETGIDFTTAAEMSIHSVVHVKTEYKAEANTNFYNNDPFHNFFFGPQRGGKPMPQLGSGSGVIVSDDGYIVTNNHVIDGASKIEVILNDKKTYTADLIGKDPTTDLALLKISEKGLPYVTYGNSDEVKVGEWVLAVGNPFNLTSTVTAGIVSAKGRSINILENDPSKGLYPIESFIQTDAAVNPGNSGGALVNTNGELIGINSAIASNTGSYAGYSFAIPVNIVKKVTNDLLEYGTVQRAFIGVSIREIDSRLADEKQLKDMRGVYVAGLSESGSAMDAGIKEGDVITRVGDVVVNSPSELQEQVGRFRPGDKILVTVNRDGKEKEMAVLLKNRNGNTGIVEKEKIKAITVLGASFSPISGEEKKKLKIDHGIKINKLEGGKLLSAGVKEGFIITNIDKKPIKDASDIENALDGKKGGILIEGLYPNGLRAYYGFGI